MLGIIRVALYQASVALKVAPLEQIVGQGRRHRR
jgi:hypothetical protein